MNHCNLLALSEYGEVLESQDHISDLLEVPRGQVIRVVNSTDMSHLSVTCLVAQLFLLHFSKMWPAGRYEGAVPHFVRNK